MPRYEFRVHVAIDAATEREARENIDGLLDHARDAQEASDRDHNFTAELDEGGGDPTDN